jgi:hypothetical protein
MGSLVPRINPSRLCCSNAGIFPYLVSLNLSTTQVGMGASPLQGQMRGTASAPLKKFVPQPQLRIEPVPFKHFHHSGPLGKGLRRRWERNEEIKTSFQPQVLQCKQSIFKNSFLFLHLFVTVVLDLCFPGRNIFYFGFDKVA